MSTATILEIRAELRSQDFTVQCRAVSKIPQYLAYNPNPDEIKSVFKTLAERFCAPDINNYFRSVIMRIIVDIAPKYIKQITNMDDQEYIIYNIVYILCSHDPTARTLAFKTLGAFVKIAVDKNNVKHYIRKGIVSKDSDERNAAIETTRIFTTYSTRFAKELLPELSLLIFAEESQKSVENSENEVSEKVSKKTNEFVPDCSYKNELIQKIFTKLIQNMYGNLQIAETAVNICIKAMTLPEYSCIALQSATELVKKIKPLAGALIGTLLAKFAKSVEEKSNFEEI